MPRRYLMLLSPVVLADVGVPRLDERSVELYALALSYPFVSGAQLFEDVAGRHVRAAAAVALAPEKSAAAKARARDLDWWETAEELLVELRQLGWSG